jgi:hypothetical protein
MQNSTSQYRRAPACALGSLLLTGVALALPFSLLPPGGGLLRSMGTDLTNLYTVTAWMGLAHFVFAYHSQYKKLKVIAAGSLRSELFNYAIYAAILIAVASLLVMFSEALGHAVFAAVVWLYFIIHFMRAELLFLFGKIHRFQSIPQAYVLPVLAYFMFAVVLLWPGPLPWSGAMLSARVLALTAGTGVALASFYHYLRAYQFAMAKTGSQLHLSQVLVINLVVAFLASSLADLNAFCNLGDLWPSNPIGPWLLSPIMSAFAWATDTSTFVIWVALHLVSSDLCGPIYKFLQEDAGRKLVGSSC